MKKYKSSPLIKRRSTLTEDKENRHEEKTNRKEKENETKKRSNTKKTLVAKTHITRRKRETLKKYQRR